METFMRRHVLSLSMFGLVLVLSAGCGGGSSQETSSGDDVTSQGETIDDPLSALGALSGLVSGA